MDLAAGYSMRDSLFRSKGDDGVTSSVVRWWFGVFKVWKLKGEDFSAIGSSVE